MTETLTPVTAHFALTSNNLDLALKAAAHPSIAHAISPKNFDPWSFPEVVLHKLAANPVCPRETLRLIATRKSPSLIAAILDHPKCDESVRLLVAAVYQNREGAELLAARKEASPAVLRILAGSACSRILAAIAANPSTPTDTIRLLLDSIDTPVACCAARRLREVLPAGEHAAWIARRLGFCNKRILGVFRNPNSSFKIEYWPLVLTIATLTFPDNPTQVTNLLSAWESNPPEDFLRQVVDLNNGEHIGLALLLRHVPFCSLAAFDQSRFPGALHMGRMVAIYLQYTNLRLKENINNRLQSGNVDFPSLYPLLEKVKGKELNTKNLITDTDELHRLLFQCPLGLSSGIAGKVSTYQQISALRSLTAGDIGGLAMIMRDVGLRKIFRQGLAVQAIDIQKIRQFISEHFYRSHTIHFNAKKLKNMRRETRAAPRTEDFWDKVNEIATVAGDYALSSIPDNLTLLPEKFNLDRKKFERGGKIRAIKTVGALRQLGDELKNCLSSLVRSCFERNYFYALTDPHGKTIGCVEIDSEGTVKNARGHKNAELPQSVHQDLIKLFETYSRDISYTTCLSTVRAHILSPYGLSLEVGSGIKPLVDETRNGELLLRIKKMREYYAEALGFVIPQIQIKDNIEIGIQEYRILWDGRVIGSGQLFDKRLCAMDNNHSTGTLDGIEAREPVFGLDARWITQEQIEEAEDKGYRVVDHAALIQAHLAHVIEQNAGDMITVKSLLRPIAELRYSHPQLVDEVIGAGGMRIDTLVKILSNLLKEHVSIGDLRTIFETLAANIRGTCQAEALTIEVRNALQCPAVAEDRAMGNLR